MSATGEPVPFEVYEPGVYLHGTKADLAVGEMLVPGRESNFEEGRVMNHVYFTATLDAAVWGAELAAGQGRGRIYIVEPSGEFEDDPNVTDKRFPGNPTQSFRSREPLRVVGELVDWVGHSPEKLQAMRDGLACVEAAGCSRRSRTDRRPRLDLNGPAGSATGVRGVPDRVGQQRMRARSGSKNGLSETWVGTRVPAMSISKAPAARSAAVTASSRLIPAMPHAAPREWPKPPLRTWPTGSPSQ